MIKINYCDYKRMDFLNGTGIRNSLFVSGCTHHCVGCFNAPAWNFNYGQRFTKDDEDMIVEDLKDERIRGLSLLGGEPFDNVEGLLPLLKRVKEESPRSDIWCWSGYTFEYLKENQLEMLELLDVLVDGKFEIDNKDLKLKFRGSSNQRVINAKESLKNECIVML
ncbi:anaerobic ribonucleotide reductase-activating protein [compost metagenome]